MYKLYYSPGACSMAVHVALNEIGAPYEADRRSTKDGSLKTPEFLKINPRGQIPVLKDGDDYIKEGAAILIYLLDKHKSALLPRDGIARAKALEWLCWCNATLHPAYGKAFWTMHAFDGKPFKDEVLDVVIKQIQSLWDEAEARLGQSKYLAGDTITVADILMTVIANWGVSDKIKRGPNTLRVIREVIARPSYQKALKDEDIEYKAAA